MISDPLVLPTPIIMRHISQYGPIVEIGGGNGLWKDALTDFGVDIVSYDIVPQSDSVLLGDENAAAQLDRNLLMIWPPNNDVAQAWINVKTWPVIIFIGPSSRYQFNLDAYNIEFAGRSLDGRKGSNDFLVFRLKND